MNIVVVGGGLAGAAAVEELRAQGYDGEVTLVGAERHAPYERPPLSKGVLLGSQEPESVFVHDLSWYADHGVALRLGTEATAVDLTGRRVLLGDEAVPWDRLLLATGSEPRRLAVDDPEVDVVHLRTLDDSLALKPRLAGHVLVVGAGWIGLEVAAAARLAGAEVTVVEATQHPLGGVLGSLAPVLLDLHREHGVDVRLATTVTELRARDGRVHAELSDGHRVVADLVVAGIGARPCDAIAADAGLATDDGVLVDAALRASDPDVYAAGDVARHAHPVLGRRIRVEHWDAALHQGPAAARAMLGDDTPYTRLPYFFTDQYDLGLEYVGSVGPEGYDGFAVRGDVAGRVVTAVWTSGDRVVAGMHMNDWDAIDVLRELVGGPVPVGLLDPRVPLATLVG